LELAKDFDVSEVGDFGAYGQEGFALDLRKLRKVVHEAEMAVVDPVSKQDFDVLRLVGFERGDADVELGGHFEGADELLFVLIGELN